MSHKISLRSIATELGVSPATVLRALSGAPHVRVELRERIVAFAGKAGYKLSRHSTGNVLIIVPCFSVDAYLPLLVSKIAFEAQQHGFHPYVVSVTEIESFNDYFFDGVISTVWFSGLEKQYPKMHFRPFVSVNTLDNRLNNIYHVNSDDEGGTYMALQYLYDHGCRRIMFFMTPAQSSFVLGRSQRLDAFVRFTHEHQLPGVADGFTNDNGDRHGLNLEEFLGKVRSLQADAILFASEVNMAQVYYHCRRFNLDIPGDLSLIALEGADDNHYLFPPVTSLRQDFDNLAREAIKMLMRQIQHKGVRQNILIPFQFIERESVRRP